MYHPAQTPEYPPATPTPTVAQLPGPGQDFTDQVRRKIERTLISVIMMMMLQWVAEAATVTASGAALHHGMEEDQDWDDGPRPDSGMRWVHTLEIFLNPTES